MDTRVMRAAGQARVPRGRMTQLGVCPGVACAQATKRDTEVIGAVKVFVGWVSTLAEVQRVAVALCTEGHRYCAAGVQQTDGMGVT